MAPRAAKAPHRFSLDDVATGTGERVPVATALDALLRLGVDHIGRADLESYRLMMAPASFKRLCRRLETEQQRLIQDRNRAAWPEVELPFGADVSEAVRQERLEAERLSPLLVPKCVHGEFQIPGRLKLVAGREFTARGIRGRLRFRQAVTTRDGECWIEGWSPERGYRSVAPDRVRVVHAKPKLRPLREHRGVRS